MKTIVDLFLTFMRIGGLTFGGGYAMLPMLQKEVVENKGWTTEEELVDYYAIGQCTPGVIAINTATFIGHKVYGIPGAIMATIGVVFPSWIIITIIALFVRNFAQFEVVQHALSGITCCVLALVLDAVIKLGKKSLKSTFAVIVCAIVFCVALFTEVSTFVIVIISGITGLILVPVLDKIKENTKKGGNN